MQSTEYYFPVLLKYLNDIMTVQEDLQKALIKNFKNSTEKKRRDIIAGERNM